MVWLPDKEDVGVFVGDIAFSLLEVEFRGDHRENAHCSGLSLTLRGSVRSAAHVLKRSPLAAHAR